MQQRRKTCWPLSNPVPVPEGPGRAAEVVAPLEQRHPGAAVGAAPGGGQPGQAAADDHDPPARHTPSPDRPRAATHAFSQEGTTSGPAAPRRDRAGSGPGAGGRCRPWRPCRPGTASRASAAGPDPGRTSPRPGPPRRGAPDHRLLRAAQVGAHSKRSVLRRQVHPAHLVAVLHDVAEDVGDLQGHPEGVGEGLGRAGIGRAVHGQRRRPTLPATRRQ